MIAKVVKDYPFKVVATTPRKAKTATLNDWGAICYYDFKFYQAKNRENLEIFAVLDRKSTRLNSSHGYISYAVFCLKKKTLHDAPLETVTPVPLPHLHLLRQHLRPEDLLVDLRWHHPHPLVSHGLRHSLPSHARHTI